LALSIEERRVVRISLRGLGARLGVITLLLFPRARHVITPQAAADLIWALIVLGVTAFMYGVYTGED
jgi:hypothetical protein